MVSEASLSRNSELNRSRPDNDLLPTAASAIMCRAAQRRRVAQRAFAAVGDWRDTMPPRLKREALTVPAKEQQSCPWSNRRNQSQRFFGDGA
jgi:hypothetical protein